MAGGRVQHKNNFSGAWAGFLLRTKIWSMEEEFSINVPRLQVGGDWWWSPSINSHVPTRSYKHCTKTGRKSETYTAVNDAQA